MSPLFGKSLKGASLSNRRLREVPFGSSLPTSKGESHVDGHHCLFSFRLRSQSPGCSGSWSVTWEGIHHVVICRVAEPYSKSSSRGVFQGVSVQRTHVAFRRFSVMAAVRRCGCLAKPEVFPRCPSAMHEDRGR